jgi:hypothetical protein
MLVGRCIRPRKIRGGVGGALDWDRDRLSLDGEASLNTSLGALGESYSVGASGGVQGKF